MLEILALKLYFGHTCLDSQTNQLISTSLENLQIEYGINMRLEDIPESKKWWNRTHVDSAFEACYKRNIQVENQTNFLKNITENKTTMDYAVLCNPVSFTLGRINQVRLCKGLLSSFELIGLHGRNKTIAHKLNTNLAH